ncbi:ornithine cyclodeaminase/mu-crystallin family protein [Ilyonectria robusta]|uniref:ornithine cyclodeaminase/mu-crystallin family protein n=1 Tax=Ilyonectria robusta TaxID=1079257 RepID=UPI001E8EDFA0|nr:ornithine cyclodeaminase/mu-crystallin family protein [Ilyonectria robusta]KAH8666252.1 ornithine cyclodeaminase/mu-crystallin family protein [Ilyonectria robusta]
MLILSHDQVLTTLQSLSKTQCLEILSSVQHALSAISTTPSPIHQPLRTPITTSTGYTSLFMPASTTTTTGIKTVTVHSDGGPHLGALAIFAPNGELIGLLNAEELTGFRTALMTMLGFVKRVCEVDGELVIFGAGKQAEWHLRLAMLFGPREGKISRVTVVGRGAQRTTAFETHVVEEMRRSYPGVIFSMLCSEGNATYQEQLNDVLGSSAAIFCCTPSREPLFAFSSIDTPGRTRFISLIGSFKPQMMEVDPETLLSGDLLCVDTRDGCIKEAGEMHTAKVTPEQVIQMGDLLALDDNHESRDVLRKQNVVFRAVGMGVLEIVVGKAVLDIAADRQIGTRIDDL